MRGERVSEGRSGVRAGSSTVLTSCAVLLDVVGVLEGEPGLDGGVDEEGGGTQTNGGEECEEVQSGTQTSAKVNAIIARSGSAPNLSPPPRASSAPKSFLQLIKRQHGDRGEAYDHSDQSMEPPNHVRPPRTSSARSRSFEMEADVQ